MHDRLGLVMVGIVERAGGFCDHVRGLHGAEGSTQAFALPHELGDVGPVNPLHRQEILVPARPKSKTGTMFAWVSRMETRASPTKRSRAPGFCRRSPRICLIQRSFTTPAGPKARARCTSPMLPVPSDSKRMYFPPSFGRSWVRALPRSFDDAAERPLSRLPSGWGWGLESQLFEAID